MTDQTIVVNKAYSLTLAQVGKLADLAITTGKNQSELVREAIDLLYAKLLPPAVPSDN